MTRVSCESEVELAEGLLVKEREEAVRTSALGAQGLQSRLHNPWRLRSSFLIDNDIILIYRCARGPSPASHLHPYRLRPNPFA